MLGGLQVQDNIYWFEPQMVQDGSCLPSLIGDSWFWYPLPGGSLANSLAKLVAANQHTMLVLGNNRGGEPFDYVNGVYAAAVDRALVRYGTGLSAVFVSGGGNEFAGFNDLRPILGVDCSACATEGACFNHGGGARERRAVRPREALLHRAHRPDCGAGAGQRPASSFCYDYALPDGKAGDRQSAG